MDTGTTPEAGPIMTFAEHLPEIRKLTQAEKYQLLKF